MITGASYVYSVLIVLVCTIGLVLDCGAVETPTSSVTIAAPTDWEPRMIVNSVHPVASNNLANSEVYSDPIRSSDKYAYYTGSHYNYSDPDDSKGLGHYTTTNQTTTYLSHITDAYKTTNVVPVTPNNVLSRINVRPLQNEVASKPAIFNSQYLNTFRDIKTTVVSLFQRVQEFMTYMFTFFTTGNLIKFVI